MQEFHFIRPLWFLALLPFIAMLVSLYYRKISQGDWSKIIDPQLINHVLIGNTHSRSHLPIVLLGLAGLLGITALAGPTWERLPQPVFKTQSSLVILLDLSRSMNSQDVKPSRLKRAHHKISDILNARREGQTALIVFAATAFTVIPLTDDTETISAHISSLSTDLMPAQGSRPDLAIQQAIEVFKQAGTQRGKVLLISDGFDAGNTKKAAADLADAGHELLLLGVGTPEGAPIPLGRGGFLKDSSGSIVIPKLNDSEFRKLGKYQRLSIDDRDINYLFNDSAADAINLDTEKTTLEADTWKDQGAWLILPLMLIAALSFRKGILVLAFLFLIPFPKPTLAFSWDALWLNDNQKGAKALAEGKANDARELFNDSQWRAAAEYRAGDFESSVKSLENIDTPAAHYNRGNALAKLGRIPDAIAAYEKTLESQPEHEDAKHNRDVLIEQMQNAQQNQDSSKQQPSDEQQQQQNSEQQNSESESENAQNESQQSESENTEQQNAENESEAAEPQEQNAQPEENNDEQAQEEAQQLSKAQQQEAENQEVNEQWLRRIPDDPGGLLRRKFLYQYQQQEQPREEQQW